jgi:hypothetical protein
MHQDLGDRILLRLESMPSTAALDAKDPDLSRLLMSTASAVGFQVGPQKVYSDRTHGDAENGHDRRRVSPPALRLLRARHGCAGAFAVLLEQAANKITRRDLSFSKVSAYPV